MDGRYDIKTAWDYISDAPLLIKEGIKACQPQTVDAEDNLNAIEYLADILDKLEKEYRSVFSEITAGIESEEEDRGNLVSSLYTGLNLVKEGTLKRKPMAKVRRAKKAAKVQAQKAVK
jgi:hypothetical protein